MKISRVLPEGTFPHSSEGLGERLGPGVARGRSTRPKIQPPEWLADSLLTPVVHKGTRTGGRWLAAAGSEIS